MTNETIQTKFEIFHLDEKLKGVLMKKGFVFSLLILCVGCSSGGGDTLQSEIPTNNITIQSISPTSAEEGVNTEFTIEVDYQLVDFEQGEINIGFNIDELFRFSTTHTEMISKGSGSLIIKTSATPFDHEPDGSFAVYANIIESPIPSPPVTLDSDFKDIIVTQIFNIGPTKSMAIDASDLICYTDYEEQCIQY
ncbi:MAG: hypothetical protein ACJAWS_002076 [Oleiphilaceae bacterium]|jgi:hypothetical protein